MIKDVTCTSCGFNKVYEGCVEIFHNCPECGSKSKRVRYDPKTTGNNYKANICYAENERYSRSMGCPPSQIKEFEKKFPGSKYNSKGDLLIKDYPHREFERKRRGMVDMEKGDNFKW
jgi:predicted RNA-binding Zn-ribbon protein involved in translation (DUF1610 family)